MERPYLTPRIQVLEQIAHKFDFSNPVQGELKGREAIPAASGRLDRLYLMPNGDHLFVFLWKNLRQDVTVRNVLR
jgi:hypothetical protein